MLWGREERFPAKGALFKSRQIPANSSSVKISSVSICRKLEVCWTKVLHKQRSNHSN
jgi:hypothetical protein